MGRRRSTLGTETIGHLRSKCWVETVAIAKTSIGKYFTLRELGLMPSCSLLTFEFSYVKHNGVGLLPEAWSEPLSSTLIDA